MTSRPDTDAESAYGSENSSNSSLKFLKQNDHFSIQEPTTKSEIWYQWLKNRMKHYMILEAVFFILLVLILLNSYKSTTQNEKIIEFMTSIESKVKDLEKQMEIERNNPKPQEQNWESAPKVLTIKPEMLQPIHEPTEKPPVDHKSSLSVFNAANYLFGATVDSSRSTSSSLSPFLTWDQSGLVLLDRPEPPQDKAWCTNEKNPILTVNLPKYVKPTAVSYQHSKWNGLIPHGAPRKYSVWACLDYLCENQQILVSNCEYKLTANNQQEQLCPIQPLNNRTSIMKVQFQFHENHGNTEETCVNLVRVYGETDIVPKLEERTVEDAKYCSDLKHSYHHNSIVYGLSRKNCTVLYTKQCCQDCPECCAECKIEDFNHTTIGLGIANGFLYFLCVLMFSSMILMIITVCGGICTEIFRRRN